MIIINRVRIWLNPMYPPLFNYVIIKNVQNIIILILHVKHKYDTIPNS